MASSNLRKLRRLVQRAVRVVARRGPQIPTVEILGRTLVPTAKTFGALYDQYVKSGPNRVREMAEGRGAVADLHQNLRNWLPLAERDIPGFDGTQYGDQPAVPDDVLEDAERFVSLVNEAHGADGQPLSWAQSCTEALEPRLRTAAQEWLEAETANAEHQQLGARTREAAARYDQQLQLLRRTLLAAVGSRDLDYQRLRAEKANHPDPDDDPAVPPPAPVTPPAPVG